MRIELTSDQASQLLALLQGEVRELSRQMAASTEGRFRDELSLRRGLLDEVILAIGSSMGFGADVSTQIERELAHPGD